MTLDARASLAESAWASLNGSRGDEMLKERIVVDIRDDASRQIVLWRYDRGAIRPRLSLCDLTQFEPAGLRHDMRAGGTVRVPRGQPPNIRCKSRNPASGMGAGGTQDRHGRAISAS